MRIRNLTNSPYELPLAGGGMAIVPAGDTVDIEPDPGYSLDGAFWAVESAPVETSPKRPGRPKRSG